MNISAVIPCYNGEKFLREAVASINSQTYLPSELVIVNDGSTDSSLAILEELTASSDVPIVVVSQVNHGVSAARNVGIGAASGDWIAFLDVDDIWLPEMLATKVSFAKRVGMTSGLICCNYYVDEQTEAAKKHNESTVVSKVHDRLLKGPEFQRFFIEENFIGTATVMMFSRIDALRAGGFDYFMKHSEEFDFMLRFTCEYDVLVLSEPLAIKRHHGDNLSNNKELYFYSHAFSCLRNLKYEKQYSRSGFNDEIKKLMRVDADRFVTGYCNEVYELSSFRGVHIYIKSFFSMNSFSGFANHFIGFLKKLIRTLSFGLVKNRT
ncbi:glycosyltransferase family 2 protein [Corallincola spongiicola]|uniref:Glycosyltransferase family 2 protein n=1 Tax=Corallincola spongiicola TaxID=2520508 RepID=A0ABY1WTA1_9GAMM|nr:glycosyltransferase family A protein [Corallincola spongiicola]TAA47752.1 glycosyltransferase family 2 protein [Corallincola spongiicola]